jgi:uncharacterized protein YjbI with pentapeptide repeats
MSYRTEIEQMLRTMPSDWKAQWAGARSQLRALEYDAPAKPDVDDAMTALYLTAGGNESGDPIKGPIPVPAAVRDEAMRALRMAHQHNYGAWNFIGVARAIQLAVVPSIGVKSTDRMRAFFTRHAKDARAPHFGDNTKPSRGYLAHLVWGGDPAKAWVNSMARTRRNPTMRRNSTDLERALAGDKNLADAYLFGANLRGANLTSANLRDADLIGADLFGANLTTADLTYANLRSANLRDADLIGAYLLGAYLLGADLTYANLRGANLTDANLTDANLTGADLTGADLTDANLTGANLTGADLTGADLTDVNLTGADLTGAKGLVETTKARSFGRQTGAILKASKPDAPVRAAEFKKKYPAEFERLKGDTQGRDLVPALLDSIRQRYATPFEWLIRVGEYKPTAQRLCSTPNRVLKFNLDLDSEQFTPRQREFLRKLAETSRRSGHPHERDPLFTVGWVRLCVDDKAQTVLIEEVQSDVSVVRSKLKSGEAPAGLGDYADVLAELQPLLDRFYEDAIGYVFIEAEKQGYSVEMLEYEAKRSMGSPRNIYTDLPRSMGMRPQKGSRVLPELAETWHYKPNPKRKKR